MSRDFPTLPEVVAMRARLCPGAKLYGWDRQPSSPCARGCALEAALMRPRLGYCRNLVEKAAAPIESLANNHRFLDGNKRVAFFVADTFLRMNGHRIECDSETAHAFSCGCSSPGRSASTR
jgi:death-on-curing protein